MIHKAVARRGALTLTPRPIAKKETNTNKRDILGSLSLPAPIQTKPKDPEERPPSAESSVASETMDLQPD